MKAQFDGRDYHIYLDPTKLELDELVSSNICADLKNLKDESLGQKVILELNQIKDSQGIELILLPENFRHYKEVKEIKIVINDYIYGVLDMEGEVVSTYLKTENKIRIIYRKLHYNEENSYLTPKRSD